VLFITVLFSDSTTAKYLLIASLYGTALLAAQTFYSMSGHGAISANGTIHLVDGFNLFRTLAAIGIWQEKKPSAIEQTY
jgi:hypothetical protein